MSTEPFIGEIKIFGFNFSPLSYDYCNGQTYSIAQYTALYALIGTIYGGDGQSTFNLPNLQGRVPIGQGQGPGLPLYSIGEQDGSNTTTLTSGQMPMHTHPCQGITVNVPVSTGGGDAQSAVDDYLAQATGDFYSSVPTANCNYGPLTVGGTTGANGGGLPFDITNPYLTLNYCIATEGIFPSRN